MGLRLSHLAVAAVRLALLQQLVVLQLQAASGEPPALASWLAVVAAQVDRFIRRWAAGGDDLPLLPHSKLAARWLCRLNCSVLTIVPKSFAESKPDRTLSLMSQ